MPVYFFHVKDVIEFKDEQGVDLPDLEAAKEEAVSHFGEVLQAHAGEFDGGTEWTLTVTDHRRVALFTCSFTMRESAAAQAATRAVSATRYKSNGAETSLGV